MVTSAFAFPPSTSPVSTPVHTGHPPPPPPLSLPCIFPPSIPQNYHVTRENRAHPPCLMYLFFSLGFVSPSSPISTDPNPLSFCGSTVRFFLTPSATLGHLGFWCPIVHPFLPFAYPLPFSSVGTMWFLGQFCALFPPPSIAHSPLPFLFLYSIFQADEPPAFLRSIPLPS